MWAKREGKKILFFLFHKIVWVNNSKLFHSAIHRRFPIFYITQYTHFDNVKEDKYFAQSFKRFLKYFYLNNRKSSTFIFMGISVKGHALHGIFKIICSSHSKFIENDFKWLSIGCHDAFWYSIYGYFLFNEIIHSVNIVTIAICVHKHHVKYFNKNHDLLFSPEIFKMKRNKYTKCCSTLPKTNKCVIICMRSKIKSTGSA